MFTANFLFRCFQSLLASSVAIFVEHLVLVQVEQIAEIPVPMMQEEIVDLTKLRSQFSQEVVSLCKRYV